MEGYGIILWLIVGAVAGWIAEKVMNFNTGLVMNIILGVIGSVVGNFLLSALGLIASPSLIVQLIVAVVGACILIFGYRAIKGRA
jgi:uncharacterized membrane protein YeaQ/YmgE (transglycosylase-associated protein family)